MGATHGANLKVSRRAAAPVLRDVRSPWKRRRPNGNLWFVEIKPTRGLHDEAGEECA